MTKNELQLKISIIDKRVEELCARADRYYSKPEIRDDIQKQVDSLMDKRDEYFKQLHSMNEAVENTPDNKSAIDFKDIVNDGDKDKEMKKTTDDMIDDLKKTVVSNKNEGSITESECKTLLLALEFVSRKKRKRDDMINSIKEDIKHYKQTVKYLEKQKDVLRKNFMNGSITQDQFEKNKEMIDRSLINASNNLKNSEKKLYELNSENDENDYKQSTLELSKA